ncbi:MAG: GWxTD domain-containing protein [Cyclobacteriaceae bacterium]
MKKSRTQFILFALTFLYFVANGQKLADENFRYHYDPESEISLRWNPFKKGTQMNVNWEVSKAPLSDNGGYLLQWEKRKSYAEAEGTTIKVDTLSPISSSRWSGNLLVDVTKEPWLLVAKIVRRADEKTWLYAQVIEESFPVNGYISGNTGMVVSRFVNIDQPYKLHGNVSNDSLFVYHYRQSFPSAFPPYTEATIGSDPLLLHDSTFVVTSEASINFKEEGLYLAQTDTLAAEGFSFRVERTPYPRYNRIGDLVPPLIFIATRDEYTALEKVNGDKAAFDKIILSITKDKDRARRFMRSYYQRVEQANQYFTSFKEGWKTDRGMIYVIFGSPDQVRISNQREIWYYQDSRTNFVFVKKGSIYDPNYYVLDRDVKFTELWYSTIDLWRKARF